MMINKETYELYAIDYLENNLDSETTAEMIRFLKNYPEINAELELMKSPVILTADTNIIYKSKPNLKREDKKILWSPIFVKYAAAIILLISISFVWLLNKDQTTTKITANKEIINNDTKHQPIISPSTTKPEEIIAKTEVPEPRITTNNNKSQKPKQIKQLIIRNNTVKIENTEPLEPSTEPNNLIANNTEVNNSINQEPEITTSEPADYRIEITSKPLDLIAGLSKELSTGSMTNDLNINPPVVTYVPSKPKKRKGSWILDAITKKSDGTKIFAFEGVKRALTPTRLRDVTVDKSSSDSPLKQFTHD